MTIAQKLLLFALLLLSISSCKMKSGGTAYSVGSLDFEPDNFGLYNSMSSLDIRTKFSECGEWGGHEEVINITTNEQTVLHANYAVYPFKCDSLEYYIGRKDLQPTLIKQTVLDPKKKKFIMEYIVRLTRSKMTEQFPGHSGNSFIVVNSDSTLHIDVYSSKAQDLKSYQKLVTELFELPPTAVFRNAG